MTATNWPRGPRYRLVSGRTPVSGPPTLSPSQATVATHRGGPLLVLAGPGTGKTTALVETVVQRINDGVDPASVLVLTFSRRAAMDLRRRIASRVGRSVGTPQALTFHSFCYSVVRRFGSVELYGDAVRLLTAPEQDFRVREVLAGRGVSAWPDGFDTAFGTRGFVTEIRTSLAAARQLGLDGDALRQFGDAAGRPSWIALGDFFDEYLDVLEAEQVLDYAELVHRTRVLLSDSAIREQVRRSARLVLVDEYQDTDPSQVGLLRQLVELGGDIVAFGDPDQSIYEFRGSRPRAVLDFPDTFPTADGTPAPVVALAENYRFGGEIARATRRLASRLSLPRALDADVFGAFRVPAAAAGTAPGDVSVLVFDSVGAEAAHVADLLRNAHLRDGLAWHDMAVLVRSGRRGIPKIARALAGAGVPIEVAGDEIALAASEVLQPLLLAVSVVVRPSALNAETARQLVQSPLCGIDSIELRRLGRDLRDAERAELAGLGSVRSSSELLGIVLADSDLLDACPDTPEVRRVKALSDLLQQARDLVLDGATAHEVLWALWSGTDWPGHLQAQLGQGGEAARAAHRALDAVCALFDVAERSDQVVGGRGVTGFLSEVAAQEIPADTTRESTQRPRGVRLLTAHRAKGLEWPLVVVSGVQEGIWPDPRRRGSLLEPDRLTESGPSEPSLPAARLAAERRLFYVACTRASRRLVVTSVAGQEGEGDQPSRFLAELGVVPRTVAGRPRRPLSLPALVGELRRVAGDPSQFPGVREGAARRLGRLAEATGPDGQKLVLAADPARWWGLSEPTTGQVGRAPGSGERLSGSQVGALLACPRQWFLERRAGAQSRRTSSANFGSVIHVLAEHAVADGLSTEHLSASLDRVWHEIDFDAVWLSTSERAEADAALERLAAWIDARRGRQMLGVEVPFEVRVETQGVPLTLTGVVDRLDRDASGRLVIVDFKTGRRTPTQAAVEGLDQVGVYQLAASLGAFDEVADGVREVGGAELVYLRANDGQNPFPKVLRQASLTEQPYLADEPSLIMLDDGARAAVGSQADYPTWVHHRLATAAKVLAEDRFVATVGDACRWCAFTTSCPAQSAGRQVLP